MTAIDQSWLDSLQCPPHPGAQEICEPHQQNKNNQPNGRCITISSSGAIFIGYYKDGGYTVGNWIHIWSDGNIYVGDRYVDSNGSLTRRYTYYKTDGTSRKY
jgi:hypothetical protein